MSLATTVRRVGRAAILAVVVLTAAGCGVPPHQRVQGPPRASGGTRSSGTAGTTANRRPVGARASPDVYAADRPGMLSPVVRRFPSRVYVPDSDDGTVDVIDPATRRVVDQFPAGRLPQHVVPSWDLRRLW